MPSRYWEPGCEEVEAVLDTAEAQEWIEQNGIPEDPELPFN